MNYTPLHIHDLETGDILTARVERLKVINHVGYILRKGNEVYVLHNSPDRCNEHGGNIITDTLQDFCQSRTPLFVERTGMSAEQIETYAHEKRHITFDTVKHNCEHFVYGLRDKIDNSPQLKGWLILGTILLLLLLIEDDE